MEKMIMSKGSRKTAIARVILKPGKGNIIINKKEISKYVPQPELQEMIYQPFNLTDQVCSSTRITGNDLSTFQSNRKYWQI